MKCIVHRPLVGSVKTCTIRRQAGKWFACFACEVEEVETQPLPESAESVGIDVGLHHFAALSDGTLVTNPRFFRRDEKALAKAQRKQAKTRKRSPERRKANKVLSRIHERIRNRRHDFVAKSISDASWSMFRAVLTVKAESAARRVVEIDPAYTSQDCHQCGNRAKKPLKERWHHCPICGASLDRDTNAAINILQKAILAITGTAVPTAVGQHGIAGIPA